MNEWKERETCPDCGEYNVHCTCNEEQQQGTVTYDAATDLLNCTCGNTTHTDGFVAVDENGLECEPYEGWGNRYMCQTCGATITLEVL